MELSLQKQLRLLLGAALIGAINAIVFVVFEYLVGHGTDVIWNQWLGTDTTRWLVVPVAIVGSLALSWLMINLSEQRVKPAETSLMGDLTGPPKFKSLGHMAAIFVVGLGSLWAGASLGPEMTLTLLASASGIWIAYKFGAEDTAALMSLAGIGALLTVFVNSLLLMLVPLLLIFQQAKQHQRRIQWIQPATVIITSLAAYFSLHLLRHEGALNVAASTSLNWTDVVMALVFGVIGFAIAQILMRLITRVSSKLVATYKDRSPYLAAGVFGLVLGIIYLVGGQSVQFTGKEGSQMLLHQQPGYGVWLLIGLLIIKLAATAWSKAAGYWGGLVFPTVYVGIAAGLAVQQIDPNIGHTGVMIGLIGGIFAGLTGPIVGAIFLAAALPANATPLVLLSVATALFWKRRHKQPA